jgi:hypothetical protein
MMLYIHGVNHNTQHFGSGHDVAGGKELSRFVRHLCCEREVAVIGEEFSEEACESNSVSASSCQVIAEELGLIHVFCDPNSRDRELLGIPSQRQLVEEVKNELGLSVVMGPEPNALYDKKAAEYHCVRERYWLGKLNPYRPSTILFVCGSEHINSFSALLDEQDWPHEIV